ncbi:MAG: hypothetical protein JXQ75_18855 [Phycisphaerae bacterium]|nr:hypothetical protein [Phycisphaerae bacterium]
MACLTSNERVHLAVCPIGTADGETFRNIAAVTGATAYDLRLRLKGDLPRSVACYDSVEEAEARAQRLNELGLTTIVYVQEDLPFEKPFEVFRLGRDGTHLELAHRRGEALVMPASDVALAVVGRRNRTSTTTEHRFERRYYMGHGGMSGLAHVEEQKRQTEATLFLILFPREFPGRAVEFCQDKLDYSCLGDKRAPTKRESFLVLLGRLREFLSEVPIDKRLLAGQSTNRGDIYYNRRVAEDSSLANATLIYWQTLAEQGGRQHFAARRGGA